MSIELAKTQLELLDHRPGEFTEIRIPGGHQSFHDKQESYLSTVEPLLKGDVYVGINPRLRAKGDSDSVAALTTFVFDIDPVRPRGEPSSDGQHGQSLDCGQRIAGEFGNAFVISSGSGCHVYIPLVRVPNRREQSDTARLREWFKSVQQTYETPGLKIDSIWDAPRIIRVWGSHNNKSNRPCVPVAIPDTITRIDAPWLKLAEKKAELFTPTTAYEKRFQKLCLSNQALGRIVRQEARFDSRSEADYAYISILVRAHFSEEEIKQLMRFNPLGRGEDKGDSDVARVVSKVIENETDTLSLIHHSGHYFKNLPDRKVGISTGIKTLDEMISGLKSQKTYLLAARPTDGKTTLTTQILTHVAEASNVCLFHPTEVGAEPIWDKVLSRKTKISLRKFQNGDFNEAELKQIDATRKAMSHIPLIVNEDFGLTPQKIEDKVREICPDLLAVDFIQALAYKEGGTPQEIAAATRALKEIAGDYRIPVVIASQLRRGDGKLDLSQLKGSGALEELCDVVCFLYTLDKLNYPRQVELNVMKSKYSETGPIKLKFFSTTCHLEE